jgi:pyruvate kinase
MIKKIADCKTKIVVTLGPSTSSQEKIETLAKLGVGVFRINFSHGTYEQHKKTIQAIREVEEKLNLSLAILQDLQGPKIRLGEFENGTAFLRKDSEFVLTTNKVKGNKRISAITCKDIGKDVKRGELIYLNDGLIKLEIQKITGKNIYTKVIEGGTAGNHNGVNFPTSQLSVASITEKDKKDLKFGLENNIDMVAQSFIKTAKDVLELKNLMRATGKTVPIISKIEKWEAVKNLKEIIEVSDGIMVARGDLGVEMSIAEIPIIQKQIISLCNKKGKPVITATQMLSSMVENPTPTRAEVTDISNAIFDGTDAVMLSNETAVGKFPIETVEIMQQIIQSTEKSALFKNVAVEDEIVSGFDVPDAIAHSAAVMAKSTKAKIIISATESGKTAMLVSKYKPSVPILALTPKEQTLRFLLLKWGVFPVKVNTFKTVDEILNAAPEIAKHLHFLKKKDLYIITAGTHAGVSGSTNLIKIDKI